MATQGPVAKLKRDGSLLVVETLNEVIARALEDALSYTRKIQLRGMAAARASSHITFQPVSCCDYRGDPAKGLPLRLVAAAGFLPRVCRVLRDLGYTPLVKNVRPCDHPERFQLHWDHVDPQTQWRWKQRLCCRLMERHEYMRIGCPTGWGKSFIIARMAELWPTARIAVAAHNIDVVEQLHRDLSESIPIVGLVCGRRRLIGDRVTVYSGKSLHHCDKPVDALFVDECHQMGTDDYLDKLSSASFRYARRYGFSASHEDRLDGAHFELEGVFGEILLNIPYQEAVAHGCVVPITVNWNDVLMEDICEDVKDPTNKERMGIWQNETRNRSVAARARHWADQGQQVLVSVSVVEHAMFLKRLLPDFELCYSEGALDDQEFAWYVDQGLAPATMPKMTLERRRLLKHNFESGRLRKVIANTVWNQGVDFRRLAALVRADAKNSPVADKQIPGRTARLCEETGKTEAVVEDFKDQFNKTFKGRYQDRRSNYRANGWRQIDPPPSQSRYRQGELF